MEKFKSYEEFSEKMLSTFPAMFGGRYGGFDVGPGWWPIIFLLCRRIQGRIDWRKETIERLQKGNPYNIAIPEEIPQVEVTQIKEKFGGLRFYYVGGDDHIHGLVAMTESWCAHTCESCGNPGRSRSGGWIKTLCDEHAKADEEEDDEYES